MIDDEVREMQRLYNIAMSQSMEIVTLSLPMRSRFKRALRWPLTLLKYRRCGVSWWTALKLTHWSIWY